MRTLLSLSGVVVVLAASACGGPDPKMVAAKNDGVPANSASEERLKTGEKKEEPKATHDPSQPYTQPVSGGGTTATASNEVTPGGPKEVGAAAGKKDPKEKPAAGGKGSKDKVSKAECGKALDRGLDLMMSGDSRFEGIPPEMIAQFKQQGLSQVGGPNPCDGQGLTKTQYDCAMAAPTSSAWQRCIK